jgi:UDP-glucose 4-epimerase
MDAAWSRADAAPPMLRSSADSMPVDPAPAGVAAPLLRGPARVTVTGGAGFVGSHLVEELLRAGHAVHVVDDLSTGSLDNLAAVAGHARLAVTIASVATAAGAQAACAGAEFVFHLAGVVGVQRLASEPLLVMQQNLHATERLLAAAAAARVPVLLASSSEVYGDGPVPFRERDPVRPGSTEGLRGGYACAKAMGEWLAFGHREATGLPVVVARLFNTIGPRQPGADGMVLPRFIGQALRGEPITVYGDGSQTRCFAAVGEVVRALAALAAAPGAEGLVVNVGSDQETTVRALAELVRQCTGSRSPIVEVPFGERFPRGFGDPCRRVPSLERLRALIGWAPAAPLPAIVEEAVAWHLARQPGTVPLG